MLVVYRTTPPGARLAGGVVGAVFFAARVDAVWIRCGLLVRPHAVARLATQELAARVSRAAVFAVAAGRRRRARRRRAVA
jgi:hypothetical protein